jgi:hypothetical protein
MGQLRFPSRCPSMAAGTGGQNEASDMAVCRMGAGSLLQKGAHGRGQLDLKGIPLIREASMHAA